MDALVEKTKDMDIAELHENAERASALLKVMGNKSRLMIMCHLLHGEKSVQELEGHIGLTQSALSQQLANLRGQHLVTTRRQAQSVFYALASPEAETLIGTLYELYCNK
ncbi:MAG: ArsR/SmtB family transcription factor [Paracoccaceae bacterium]